MKSTSRFFSFSNVRKMDHLGQYFFSILRTATRNNRGDDRENEDAIKFCDIRFLKILFIPRFLHRHKSSISHITYENNNNTIMQQLERIVCVTRKFW